MPGRRRAWSSIPIVHQRHWDPEFSGRVSHWFRRAGYWLSAAIYPLYDPPGDMAGQILLFNPCIFRSVLLLQPVIQWLKRVRGSPGLCSSHRGLGIYGLGAHLRPLAQFLLPCCVKSSLRTDIFFFWGGKCVLIQHWMFFLVSVCCSLFVLQAAEGHFKSFSWSMEGSETQGYPCMPDCRDHSLALAAINLPYQRCLWRTANRESHCKEACEGHKQIQQLRHQCHGLTWSSYHMTAHWLSVYTGT